MPLAMHAEGPSTEANKHVQCDKCLYKKYGSVVPCMSPTDIRAPLLFLLAAQMAPLPFLQEPNPSCSIGQQRIEPPAAVEM